MKSCSDTTTDTKNCGSCGNACPTGEKCLSSSCTTCAGINCSGTDTCCPSGSGKACTNLQSDAQNCGKCGTACPTGEKCVSGSCTNCGGTTCTSSQTCCTAGGTKSCVDLTSDSNNCGSCGNGCPSGYNCQNSGCTDKPPCTNGPQPYAGNFRIDVYCNTFLTNTKDAEVQQAGSANSFMDCVNSCFHNLHCCAGTYDYKSHACTTLVDPSSNQCQSPRYHYYPDSDYTMTPDPTADGFIIQDA